MLTIEVPARAEPKEDTEAPKSPEFQYRASDRPGAQTGAFVERPVVSPPPVPLNEEASTALSLIAGRALGLPPESLPALRDEYARTGRIAEYKRLNALASNVNDVQQAQLVGEAITKSVQDNKIDISSMRPEQVEEYVRPIVDKHAADKALLDANPETTDHVRQLHAGPRPQLADAFDAEEGLGSEVLTADHVRFALSLGKDQNEAVYSVYADKIDRRSFWKDFAQSIFATASLPYVSKVLTDELALSDEWVDKLSYGNTVAAIQELIMKSPPAQQRVIYEKIGKVVRTHPAFYPDYNVWKFYDTLFSPEFLAKTGTDSPTGQMMENFYPFLDIATYPGGKLLTSAFFRLTASARLKAMAHLNPTAYGEELAAALEASPSAVRKLYSVEKPVLAQLNLPTMPESTIFDTADIAELLEERTRMLAISADLKARAAALHAEAIPLSTRVSMAERDAAQLSNSLDGKVLPNKTTIAPFSDGTGYRLETMLGRRSDKGFASLKAARDVAQRAINRGAATDAEIWYSSGGVVARLMPFDELAGKADDLLAGTKGNFYVKLRADKQFTEYDHALSATGRTIELSHSWLGRARNYATSPSAWMDRKIYTQYLRRFSAQSGITAQLDAIVNPWLKLSTKSKWRINDALEWSADFGKREKRNPTIREIQDQFGGTLTPKELKGLYSARAYFDTLYELENSRVLRYLDSKGAKTIRTTDGKIAYHGVPYSTAGKAKKVTRAYDPAKNAMVELNPAQLDEIYKAGGRVIKTDIAPSLRGSDEVTHHVLFDPRTAKGWEYGALSRRPLKYIHGYYPRMYQDPYIIMKTMPKVMVDGVMQSHTIAVHTAGSRKEAAEAIARLTELNADKKWTYSMKRDVRLSQLDETAANQELMRMEGRLFYDERNLDRLTHVSGAAADIIAPINTIARSARMLAKQVTMEDFNTHMVDLWTNSFGRELRKVAKEVGYKGNTTIDPDLLSVDSAIRALESMANEPGKLGKVGKDALEAFRYIQMMRGAMDPSSNLLRSKLISLGEMLYNNGAFSDSIRKFGSRDLWKFSPLQATRELTFFMFIAANPIKQFVLNAQQHMFLLALDPAYIGRWQLDTAALLIGARARNQALAGEKILSTRAMKLQARAMRLTDEEYQLLVDNFTSSGLLNNVNIRAALGDIPTEAANVPMTQTGRVASHLWGTVSARPLRRWAESRGFDAGEQINLTASYLPALRSVMRTNKLKSLTQLTPTQWAEVATKALDYSSAMIRPNASRYQHGLLAVPLQFLQFQHKTFITLLGMNKAFTRKEHLKILGAQILMFGGGVVGLTPEVKKGLAEVGVTDPFLVDVISGGFIDWTLDKSFQAIFDDPEMNSNWTVYLSPASGVRQLAEDFAAIAFENAPIESFFGVSGYGASKVFESAKMAHNLLRAPEGVSWDEKKVRVLLDTIAAGTLSGYSQMQHAIVARKLGFWQAANGEVSSIEARTGELFMRGFLGVQPEEFETRANLLKGLRGDTLSAKAAEELKSDAKKYYEDLLTMVNRYGEGVYSRDYFLTMTAALRQLIVETRDPDEAEALYEEFNSLVANRRGQQDSLEVAIVKAIKAGGDVEEWMITEILASNAPQEQKDAAVAFARSQMKAAEDSVPGMLGNIDTNLQYFKPDID